MAKHLCTDPDLSQRIVGPAQLVQAIPYLVGFHPTRSLVLVGLNDGKLVVTARLDLADARSADVIDETLRAMCRGGSREVVAAVYDETGPEPAAAPSVGTADPRWSRLDVGDRVEDAAAAIGVTLIDVLLVVGPRWWSLSCASPHCCPSEGRPMLAEPSAFAAAATYSGRVALTDRSALERLLDPLPDTARAALEPAVADSENESVNAVLEGTGRRLDRSRKRALFAAARSADEPGWNGVGDAEAARFGVALTQIAMRDAVWMAVDDGRLDGRPLWRDLGRRLPSPYDAAPMFLFGWATWRAGDGALAGIAAVRAVASDPEYSAADLLLAAVARGVDPRQLPRLRLPRTA